MQGVTFCNLNLKFNIVLWIEFRKNYSRNLLSTWATQICPWEITSGMQLFNVLFCEMYVYTLCLQSHGNGEGCSTAVGVFFFFWTSRLLYLAVFRSHGQKNVLFVMGMDSLSCSFSSSNHMWWSTEGVHVLEVSKQALQALMNHGLFHPQNWDSKLRLNWGLTCQFERGEDKF